MTCYHRNLRGTSKYEKECPTKNIRWQSGDSRFWKNDKYNFEAFIFMFLDIFTEETKVGILQSSFVRLIIRLYESLLKIFSIQDILYYFHIISQYGLFTEQFNKAWFTDDNIKSVIKKQLNKVLDRSEPELKEKFNKKWYNWTIEYIYHNTSINKINNDITLDFDKFNTFYKMLAHVFVNITGDITVEEKLENQINNKYAKWIDISKNKSIINDLLTFCNKEKNYMDFMHYKVFSTSMFLDLYTVLRAFKKPSGGRNALVAFGCFGAAHTKDIVFLLTNIMSAYEVVFSNSNLNLTEPARCVEINKDVNLNEIITFYKNIKVTPSKVSPKVSPKRSLPRCPKGTRRNKKTGECEKINKY